MRAVLRAVLGWAVLLAAAGCGVGDGPYVEGEAPTVADDARPVYVTDAAGEPLQRPTRFAVTENTAMISLTWDSWGGDVATATGMVTGTWCLPECQDGYPGSVELRDPVRGERVLYYSRATVRSRHLLPEMVEWLTDVSLYSPEGMELAP
jgi:hypothetical protein